FAHALIRDAAYAGMPKRSRALLHETFAGWLETTRAEYAVEIEEITAYHLEQASRLLAELGGDDDRARALAMRAAELLAGAGRRALARSDMPAAANLLGRAVDLEPQRASAEPLLLRELSSALWATGQLALAERTQREALDAELSVGDRRVEWYVPLDRSVRRNLTDPDASEELQAVAREAVAVFEELGDE